VDQSRYMTALEMHDGMHAAAGFEQCLQEVKGYLGESGSGRGSSRETGLARRLGEIWTGRCSRLEGMLFERRACMRTVVATREHVHKCI
jgi:hypothetical protein